MCDLADIIAQETGDGRLIVRFLVSAMDGDLPDFLPCHRIDAARLLVKLGFDQAQTHVDLARADQRARQRESRSQSQTQQSESQSAAQRVRAQLAQIVREETDDGRTAVQFLVNVMQGELADFKPCHRLSAAKELLQRGFDYVPEEIEAQPAAEPEPDPAELLAQLHLAEDIEFSKHGPVYYKTYPYPCVCEDRLHDCKGNVLTEEERPHFARKAPGMQSFLDEPHRIRDYLERYAEYLGWWNTEHPGNPVDIKRIHWTAKRWQHLNPVGSINPAEALKRIRGP